MKSPMIRISLAEALTIQEGLEIQGALSHARILERAVKAGEGPAEMHSMANKMLSELMDACGGRDAPLSGKPVEISAALAHGLLAHLAMSLGPLGAVAEDDLEAAARAHDEEESAQKGEPSLWAIHDRGDWQGDEGEFRAFRSERFHALRAAFAAQRVASHLRRKASE